MGTAAATESHSLELKGFRYALQSKSLFSGARKNTENLDEIRLMD